MPQQRPKRHVTIEDGSPLPMVIVSGVLALVVIAAFLAYLLPRITG